MYFWKYILAKKAGLSQKKCNMALYGLPVLPIAEAFEKTVTGNPISVTDALAQDALSLQVAFTPTQDGTPSIDSEPTTEPYLSKVVPRGNKEYYSLVGGTVAWNQLVQITDFVSVTYGGITGTNNGDGTYTVNGRARDLFDVYRNYEIIANHVYFVMGCPSGGSPYTYRLALASENDEGSGLIYKSEYGGNETLAIRISNGTEVNNLVFRPQLIDLTLMFANEPAIANYVYTLEQSEAGSGIAWLKSYGFFSKIYYVPNAGELISVNTSGHKIGSTTYPIDPTDLRGLFKLSNGKLYCKGDVYPPSGGMSRKYGIVDLGTLNWTPNGSSGRQYYGIADIEVAAFTNNLISNADYRCASRDAYDNVDGTMSVSGGKLVWISDSRYSTASDLKTSLSGKYLVVERKDPTAESATPYTSPIDVEAGGTEEFVDNRAVPIPVGNETYYASEYAVHGKTGVTVSHGATADDPNPTEYEVEFTSQGTVYGGTVDIVTGVLTVTWGFIQNMASLSYTKYPVSTGNLFRFAVSNLKNVDWQSVPNVICERYPSVKSDGRRNLTISQRTEGNLDIIDSRFDDETLFAASMSGVKLAYELATPLIYQLTPQQVQMLLNDNYLTTEDGTITLTYMADR